MLHRSTSGPMVTSNIPWHAADNSVAHDSTSSVSGLTLQGACPANSLIFAISLSGRNRLSIASSRAASCLTA